MATLIMEQIETPEQNGSICNNNIEGHLMEVKNTDESNTKNTNNEDKVTVDSQLHLKIKMNFVKEKISPTKLPNSSSPLPTEKHDNNNNNNSENGNHPITTTPTLPPKKKRSKPARDNLLEEAESFMQNSKRSATKRSTLSSKFAGAQEQEFLSRAVQSIEEHEKEQQLWERTHQYLAHESERERKLRESKAYWRSVSQTTNKKQKVEDTGACDDDFDGTHAKVWLDHELEKPGDTLVIFASRTFFACLKQNAKRAAWDAVYPSKVAQKNAEQIKKTKKT